MQQRRLAAIMFTDIVGYTALMGKDEDKAFEILKINREIHTLQLERHNGTLIKEMGDGILASFPSALKAVQCSITIQEETKSENISLRIGIHESDVVFEGSDVLGDGVNIASRLQESAEEGCISISGAVYRNIKNKAEIKTEFIEEKLFKNVDEPVKIYKIVYKEEVDDHLNKEKQLPKKRSNLSYYIIAGLVIIIAIILIWQFLRTKDETLPPKDLSLDKTIAVLPFQDDSPDKDNEYFCNGMMEEILTHLQRIADMRIKSRTAVEQYRDQTKDINVIGAELGVAFILEGSVRKAGENLRITAQLIDVKTGDHLWADTYDGKYTEEIFEFQSNTAKKIAASLNAVITPAEQKRIEQKPTTEIVAYDLCWRGIDMVDNYTRSKDRKYLESANYLFDKALEIDPKYLRAVYGKGHAFLMERNYDSAIFYADRVIELDPEDASGYFLKGSAMRNKPDLAIEYLLKAVELDPNNNWPNIMLGLAYYFGKNDVLKGLPYMNKALKLGGRAQPEIYNYIGYVFLSIGDYEKAKEYFKHALSLQTVCVGVFGYSLVLTVQGMFNETQHFLDSICNVSECDKNCYRLKFYGSLILKEYDQSEVYFNEFIEVEGIPSTRDSVRLAYVYKELGREQEALTILNNSRNSLENQLTESKTWRTYLPLSQIHAILDEKEKALEYLSEAAKLGLQRGYHDFILLDPTFENLWNDPEFKAIMKRAQDEKAAIRAQVRLMEERGELDL